MKRNRIAALILAALWLALFCAPAMAKVVSASDAFYCLDDVDVLSEETEGEIFFSNQLLDEACGAQIVVVTVDTTGSEAIDDYAYELFNTWEIGDKAKQNGFLLLMAIDDEDCYAVCGTGLQSKLTSGRLKQYLEEYLKDDFFAKRYDAGAKKFFEAVFAYVSDIYNADVTVEQGIAAYEAWAAEADPEELTATPGGGSYHGPANNGNAYEPEGSGDGMGILLLVLIVVFILILVARSRRKRTYTVNGGTRIVPLIFGSSRPTPPPVQPGPMGNPPGPGGYRGNARPSGGLFGGGTTTRPSSGSTRPSSGGGLFGGSTTTRPSGGSARPSSGASRPSSSSSSRPSGGFGGLFGGSSGRSSFGSARGGGGGSRGGGAGRGRH